MNAYITSVSSPIWADEAHTVIDCIVTFSIFGDEKFPFTASPADVEEHGRVLFNNIVSGKYGSIAEYISPTPEHPAEPVGKIPSAIL